jgi:hypothetical protein
MNVADTAVASTGCRWTTAATRLHRPFHTVRSRNTERSHTSAAPPACGLAMIAKGF